MDIKLLVDKWLSNKKKIRGLKDQLREVQLETRMDEASITKHLVENQTKESPTIVSEFHKKEVRIKKYQTEKLFPIKTVERKLIWEELERNSLTKDFIVLNTWKIHKYLRGKFNHAHETFIKSIRDLGLTQKSESIKLEVKDISSDNHKPPTLLNEFQSALNDITIDNRDYESDDDFHAESDYLCREEKMKQNERYQEELEKEEEEHYKKTEFYDKKAEPYLEDYCENSSYGYEDCHNLRMHKKDNEEYEDWIDFALCRECNLNKHEEEYEEELIQCKNCPNSYKMSDEQHMLLEGERYFAPSYDSDEVEAFDHSLCIECNHFNDVEKDYEERIIQMENNEELAGQTKDHLDPYDDSENEEGF